jgi:predicted  nucleic acid-binding Zn-ribbon protein
MADKCVVRNQACRRGGLNKRERHNERKNADYMNGDIIPERAVYNVHFKKPEGGYEQVFDRMVSDGVISTRGLGKDPHIVDELVFDVNTSYFERKGGYEYAVSFFEEAYRCAVEEIGGEQFVLSATMHADERNKALSEELGRDVYHYHLHVVYIPVVEKEIYYRKNNKDPELAGKLKEVITQVSHSKKWPRFKDEKGWVNSYSLLQDRFFEHMKAAGHTDIERGERGSTAEHLSVLEYKTLKESERLTAKNEQLAAADAELTAVNEQLADTVKNLKSAQGKVLSSEKIEKIPVKISRPMLGGADTASMPMSDWNNVKKTALTQAHKNEEYRAALDENAALKKEKSAWRKEKQGLANRVEELENSVNKDFLERSTVKSELHNLKNVVSRIPADVWAIYANPKAQQRNNQRGEVR